MNRGVFAVSKLVFFEKTVCSAITTQAALIGMLNRISPIFYFRDIVRYFFVIAVSALVFCSAGTAANAVEQELTDSRISYSSVNKPLKDFLDSIELQTSTIIRVDSKWILSPVSLNLNSVTVEEGLKRAFKQLGLSYALTFDAEGYAIQFYAPSASSLAADDKTIRPEKTILAYSQGSPVVQEEEAPYIPAEDEAVELQSDNAVAVDYLDLSAVPPDETGDPVLTEREIIQLRKTRIQEDVDKSLVPEDVDESPESEDVDESVPEK